MVAVISVDTYPFLAFSDLTCHLEDTGIGVFWLHCAVRRSNLEVATKRLLHQCIPTAVSGGVDISEVPGCHLLQQMSSQ